MLILIVQALPVREDPPLLQRHGHVEEVEASGW